MNVHGGEKFALCVHTIKCSISFVTRKYYRFTTFCGIRQILLSFCEENS